jgi:hypothetical protein
VVENLRVFHQVGFFVALVGRRISSLFAVRQYRGPQIDVAPPSISPYEKERTMSATTEAKYSHIGETRGCADHDHDLIHDLSRRLDCLWRYDQYVSNAEGQKELQAFWTKMKSEEQENIKQLKKLIAQHVESNCF